MLLPGCEIDAATTIADRLRGAMPEAQTCSIGVAQWDGRETATSLIARADAALYSAKDAGRNRTIVAAAA